LTRIPPILDQISTQPATAKPGSSKATELGAQLRTVGGELARRGADSAQAQLRDVERSLSGLDSIKRWHHGVYQELSDELEPELESTKRAIPSPEQELESVAQSASTISETFGLLGESTTPAPVLPRRP